MKRLHGCKLIFFFLMTFLLVHAKEKEIDSLSETLGHLIKEEIDKSHCNINIEKVLTGIVHATEGKTPPLSKEEYDLLLSKIIKGKIEEKEKENIQMANEFFLKNKKNKNIIVLLEKKLQYQVISEGKGDKINTFNTPVITIQGFLPDNTLFLSKQESVISLNDLPESLKSAIIGMKESEKRRIYIHPDLINKTFDAPSPHSLLIYEIEVIKNDKSKINTIDKNIANFSGVR